MGWWEGLLCRSTNSDPRRCRLCWTIRYVTAPPHPTHANAINRHFQPAIQFAKLSGFSPIITTASLRNTDLLKSLGATHVIDRSTPASSFASEIASITTKPILLVFDAVATAETQQLGYDTLAEGGHIVVVLNSSIQETPGSTKKVVGVIGNVQMPANREIGRALARSLPGLLEAGDIVVCIFLGLFTNDGRLTGIPTSRTKSRSYQVDCMASLQDWRN